MHKMITTHYGFSNEHIRILIDTDQSKEQPTGANIKKYLKQMVAASKDRDVFFFHFSGHGTQVRTPLATAHPRPATSRTPPAHRGARVQIKDKDGGEADRLDEAICPTDMNLICDDDLRTVFAPLSDGVKFTFVSDCCHSGSMLDHPEQQIAGNKDPNAPPQGADAMDAGQLMGMFFKGAGVRAPLCLRLRAEVRGRVGLERTAPCLGQHSRRQSGNVNTAGAAAALTEHLFCSG